LCPKFIAAVVELEMNSQTSRAKVWWHAIRYHYVTPSIFPAVVGGLVSWANGKFYLWLFILVLIVIIINHLGLNMADDYFDYKHAADKLKPGEKNPYTGGSGTLNGGAIKPTKMLAALSVCFLITISIGLYLTAIRGPPILFFGLFGVFCAVFYTAPPLSLGYRGLGELMILVNFGVIIGLGAYFIQSQMFTIEAFLATFPIGLLVFSLIVINEIPDIEEDRLAGKFTLVVRYGRVTAVKLYIISWICAFAVIVGAVMLSLIPVFCLLALLSLPLVFKSTKILREHYNHPVLLAPSNLGTIKTLTVTSFGLIAGYTIQGILNGASLTQIAIILLIVSAVYAPAAIPVSHPSKNNSFAF
jgi:1,4-dihydroxy-2-naphthoate octaprenyltransferase